MKNKTEWTVETLKDFVDQRFEDDQLRYEQRFQAEQLALKDALSAQEKAVAAALLAADRAVVKAELATEKRFEATNEFRAQLDDQARTFMPRVEAESRINSLSDKITADISRIDEKLDLSRGRLDLTDGHRQGISSTLAYIVSTITVIFLVISIAILIFK